MASTSIRRWRWKSTAIEDSPRSPAVSRQCSVRSARRRLGHGGGFLHDGAIKRPRGFMRQELRWGQTGQGRKATKGGNEHELFPQIALDVGRHERWHTSRCAQGLNTINLLLLLPCQTAKLDEAVCGRLVNHPGRHQRGANASD